MPEQEEPEEENSDYKLLFYMTVEQHYVAESEHPPDLAEIRAGSGVLEISQNMKREAVRHFSQTPKWTKMR